MLTVIIQTDQIVERVVQGISFPFPQMFNTIRIINSD